MHYSVEKSACYLTIFALYCIVVVNETFVEIVTIRRQRGSDPRGYCSDVALARLSRRCLMAPCTPMDEFRRADDKRTSLLADMRLAIVHRGHCRLRGTTTQLGCTSLRVFRTSSRHPRVCLIGSHNLCTAHGRTVRSFGVTVGDNVRCNMYVRETRRYLCAQSETSDMYIFDSAYRHLLSRQFILYRSTNVSNDGLDDGVDDQLVVRLDERRCRRRDACSARFGVGLRVVDDDVEVP